MSRYLNKKKSALFSFGEDDDDEKFLRHHQSGRCVLMSDVLNLQPNNLQERNQQRLQKQREIQARVVRSSQRSLRLLSNSEEIGISTAEELFRQRDQLQGTEKSLDEINTSLSLSKKHFQGIKSAFGILKNNLTKRTLGNSHGSGPKEELPVSKCCSTLLEAVENTKQLTSQAHPGLRMRGLAEPSQSYAAHDLEEVINENLNDIEHSITRLKVLAHGLGEEIDSQNEVVESIIEKTIKSDITIQRQNKDIIRLLKR